MCPSYCSSGLSDLIGKFFSTSKAFSTLSNLQSLALECQHSVYFPNRYLCNFQRLAKLYLVFSDVCVQRIWPMTRGYVPIRKIEYFKVKSPVDGTASRWDATYGVQESFFLSTNSCSYRFRHMSRYYSERHISRGGLEVCAIDIVRAWFSLQSMMVVRLLGRSSRKWKASNSCVEISLSADCVLSSYESCNQIKFAGWRKRGNLNTIVETIHIPKWQNKLHHESSHQIMQSCRIQ